MTHVINTGAGWVESQSSFKEEHMDKKKIIAAIVAIITALGGLWLALSGEEAAEAPAAEVAGEQAVAPAVEPTAVTTVTADVATGTTTTDVNNTATATDAVTTTTDAVTTTTNN